MSNSRNFRRFNQLTQLFKQLSFRQLSFKNLLIGLFLGFIVLGLGPTAVFSQAANPTGALTNACRQVNPTTGSGLVAYSAPNNTSPLKALSGENDGPEAGKAVFLTGSPPENSADGQYIRVWFKSIDPNFKQGWIAKKFNSNVDSLKMGDTQWRSRNCSPQ